MGYLGIDVPVYLVVTRCDVLPGFMEYFTDQRSAERAQVLGFTMPIRTRARGGARPALFDELAAGLERRMYGRVQSRAHVEVRSAVYMFPQWFAGLKAGVAAFMQRLFASNQYMDQVSARGVYFTTAADVVTVTPSDSPYASAPTGERGMFVRDLLQTVMLPDREFARPSASELQRRLQRQLTVAAPLLCFSRSCSRCWATTPTPRTPQCSTSFARR